jgi:amino acid adenylation domain-containing protein
MNDPSRSLASICRQGIHGGFLSSAEHHPDRPAIEACGSTLSYRGVREWAARVAATLSAKDGVADRQLIGIFSQRTPAAYAAVLGTLMAGKGVVPLNPSFPTERTQAVLQAAGTDVLMLDARGEEKMEDLLRGFQASLTLVFAEERDSVRMREIAERWPQHRCLWVGNTNTPSSWSPESTNANAIAYLLFTSGSTGTPKGVALTHSNLTHFVRVGLKKDSVTEQDRFSQFYDFTWDAHLFDLYACWERGACLCVPQPNQLFNPDRFFRENRITVTDMVPSMVNIMMRMGSMKPGRFPDLRLLRLGGEAVPVEIAEACAVAAPNAIIENTYGPTEATVEVTSYIWDSRYSRTEAEQGTMPIGFPYPGAELLVVNEDLEEVAEGGEGELLIGGPQVAKNYWRNPEQTERAFISIPGREGTFYRTGDCVRRAARGKPMCFLGRRDNQIKIFGARIELGEIEAAMRNAAGTAIAVAVPWPQSSTGPEGITGFLDCPGADIHAILAKLKQKLPNIMVPRQIHLIEHFPLNANGKVDRKQLLSILRAGL